MKRSTRWFLCKPRLRVALVWLWLMGMSVPAVHAAGSQINIGPSDGLLFGLTGLKQPLVAVELKDNGTSLGPTADNSFFLLDSGATSILAVGNDLEQVLPDLFTSAVTDLENNGYVTEGTFDEAGVGGFTQFDVSKGYQFDFAGSDGITYTLPQTADGIRILSNKDVVFSGTGFNGIAGMPLLVNRINTLDYQANWGGSLSLDNLNSFTDTTFSTTLPSSNGHRYSVDLNLVDFSTVSSPATSGSQTSGVTVGPLPTSAPLPMLNVNYVNQGSSATASMILDYGAQLSIFDLQMGFDLGLDSNGDGVLDDLDERWAIDIGVGGVGGSQSVSVFIIDELRLPTEQGIDLVWSDVMIAIIDIDDDGDPNTPSLVRGVLGYEILVSGWSSSVLAKLDETNDDSLVPDGFIDRTHLDLTDAANFNGTLYFDLNAAVDIVVPEPAVSSLLILAGYLSLLRRPAYYGLVPLPEARASRRQPPTPITMKITAVKMYKFSVPTGQNVPDPHTGELLCSAAKPWLFLKLETDDGA